MFQVSDMYQIRPWLELLTGSLSAFLIANYCLLAFIKRYPIYLFRQWKEDSESYLRDLPQTLARGVVPVNTIIFNCCYVLALAVSWFFLGLSYKFLASVLFITLILPIAIIDWQYLFILNILVYPLLWSGLLINLLALFTPLHLAVLGVVAGYLVIAVPEKLYLLVRKKPGIGYGDAKLTAAICAWIGINHLLILFFVSFLLAIIGFIFQIFRKSSDTEVKPIPFGPGLALTGYIILITNL